MHPPVPKTKAWVQHLFLHYLFTYTYLLFRNIMSSNLLSACNKDDKFWDHQKLTFEFLAEFASPSLLDRHISISNFFQIFGPYKM